MTKIKYLFVLLNIIAIPLCAQNITVKATMDSTAIWMGQQTRIHLETVQDKSQSLLELPLSDVVTSGVEIVKVFPADTTELSDKRIQINKDIIVTSFDSGFYYIPPFQYVLGKDTFKTNSLSLKVIPMEVDTTKAGFDIKEIQEPKFVIWDFLPDSLFWIILLVVFILGILGYFLYKKYKKKKNEFVAPESLLPPHEKAIFALNSLKDERLWQGGQEKEYYTRITDIVRIYIEERLHVNAMEMTSSELLSSLRKNEVILPVYTKLKEILELSDFVKFAKFRPFPDENERCMLYAFTLIEETKEKPVLPAIEENPVDETPGK